MRWLPAAIVTNWHKRRWLRITEIYCLTFLKVCDQGFCRAEFSRKTLGANLFHACLFLLWLAFLGLRPHHGNLCLYLCLTFFLCSNLFCYMDTSHWIRPHLNTIWPHFDYSAETLFPNKVTFIYPRSWNLDTSFWETHWNLQQADHWVNKLFEAVPICQLFLHGEALVPRLVPVSSL